MRLGPDVLRDLSQSSAIEWLQTDGMGGFAMGTAAGINTRRYHGWCVSMRPPVDRSVLLSRLEESVGNVELGVNQYPGAVHPRGHERLVAFESTPCPKWTWDAGDGLRVSKQLWLAPGSRTLCVRYEASRPCTLRIKPLLAFRDYHALQHGNDHLDRRWSDENGLLVVRPYSGMPVLRIAHSGRALRDGEGWFWSTEYDVERKRGLDFTEDLWCLGTLELPLEPSGHLYFSVGPAGTPPGPKVMPAADAFRVKRADGRPTIIAGYPWFTDWGRDTMISLPGLLIGRGLLDEAREVIRAFLEHLDRGIIPNRFPDHGEKPEYNTVDATLWMFQAAHALLEAGGDVGFVRESFFERAREIISWHERGTHFGIHVDPGDGLLVNGPQTTWMDAVVNGRAITPREGKCVEINALWFNALKLMEGWARGFGRAQLADDYGAKAKKVAGSFRRAFWSVGQLFDVVGDAAFRPNQLFAVSLPHSPLSVSEQQTVVRACEQRLLTPFGLRTLALGEPGYVGSYGGAPAARDGAYHQGTVWPWLIGPFVSAYLNALGRTPQTRARCAEVLRPLREMLERDGTLPEVFDADPPHRWGGTPAQAWSVAEVLRASALVG